MKKVKVIIRYETVAFEYALEEFINSHNVVDIQFRPTSNSNGNLKLIAMVIYEENTASWETMEHVK